MAITFVEDDYEEIRRAIDVTLTANTLPSTVISSDLYEGQAIEVVESELANLTEPQLAEYADRIKRAAKLLTAAYVVPAVPAISNETVEGDTLAFQNRDLKALASELQSRAYDAIQRILTAAAAAPQTIDTAFAANVFTTSKANAK